MLSLLSLYYHASLTKQNGSHACNLALSPKSSEKTSILSLPFSQEISLEEFLSIEFILDPLIFLRSKALDAHPKLSDVHSKPLNGHPKVSNGELSSTKIQFIIDSSFAFGEVIEVKGI